MSEVRTAWQCKNEKQKDSKKCFGCGVQFQSLSCYFWFPHPISPRSMVFSRERLSVGFFQKRSWDNTHVLITSSHLTFSLYLSLLFSSLLVSSLLFSDLSSLLSHLFSFKAGAVATNVSHEMMVDPQKRRENCDFDGPIANLCSKWWSIVKNERKTAISTGPAQTFRTKWGSIVKNLGKIALLTGPAQPFLHEMRVCV